MTDPPDLCTHPVFDAPLLPPVASGLKTLLRSAVALAVEPKWLTHVAVAPVVVIVVAPHAAALPSSSAARIMSRVPRGAGRGEVGERVGVLICGAVQCR